MKNFLIAFVYFLTTLSSADSTFLKEAEFSKDLPKCDHSTPSVDLRNLSYPLHEVPISDSTTLPLAYSEPLLMSLLSIERQSDARTKKYSSLFLSLATLVAHDPSLIKRSQVQNGAIGYRVCNLLDSLRTLGACDEDLVIFQEINSENLVPILLSQDEKQNLSKLLSESFPNFMNALKIRFNLNQSETKCISDLFKNRSTPGKTSLSEDTFFCRLKNLLDQYPNVKTAFTSKWKENSDSQLKLIARFSVEKYSLREEKKSILSELLAIDKKLLKPQQKDTIFSLNKSITALDNARILSITAPVCSSPFEEEGRLVLSLEPGVKGERFSNIQCETLGSIVDFPKKIHNPLVYQKFTNQTLDLHRPVIASICPSLFRDSNVNTEQQGCTFFSESLEKEIQIEKKIMVIGKKSVAGDCHYLIRNHTGNDCSPYKGNDIIYKSCIDEFKIHHLSDFWISGKDLFSKKNVFMVSRLKSSK